MNLLSMRNNATKHTGYEAIKLNRQKDKEAEIIFIIFWDFLMLY